MSYRNFATGACLALLLAGSPGMALSGPTSKIATVKLQVLQQQLRQQAEADRAAVAALARARGVPLRRHLPNGKVLELQRIGADGRPQYYLTSNLDAADTVATDEVWPGGDAGLNLTGNGMTVGEWDAGAVEVLHPDLYPRATQLDVPVELSDHSTHVAGTLIGSGDSLYLQARGMAYQALLNAHDWNDDSQEMIAAALAGMLVSNHSYGIAAGWLAVGGAPPDNWWWIGGPGSEDPNFGYYDDQAQLWDQIAFDAPHYLIVKAAGNDRWDIGPEPGEEFTIVDQDGVKTGTSFDPAPADCGQDGYDCLPTASVAKNILTVGAVGDVPGGYQPLAGPASVQMTGFSSWGPADDGRIKPDLMGNGWMLFSTYPVDPYFASAIGTSMAAPNVSGSLLLLQQHYENRHGSGNYMRAATLKALAIHTADETGDAAGPDYAYGWGLLNTRKAAEVITEDGNGIHQITEGSLVSGGADTLVIDVAQQGARVTATLVWSDPPGTPAAAVLDPANLMLVNDLDLRAFGNGETHWPWVLDPAQPAAAATRGDNFRDNVEQVEFTAGIGSYTLQVSHKGVLSGVQDYSLVVSIAPPAPASTGLAIDENFDAGVLPAGWSTQSSSSVNWEVRLPVAGGGRYDNNTGGGGGFAMLDNDFANTVASLQLPPLDLSAADSAVLRFLSYYPYYDTFESLNVETSLDGGAIWDNQWTWYGYNPFPSSYVVDLSNAVAGHPNALVRFLWHSGGYPGGDAWQVDQVQLETYGAQPPPPPPPISELPGQAADPAPGNGAQGVDVATVLAWSAGPLADSHRVYLGTDSNLAAGDYRGSVAGSQYNPGGLLGETLYYWRIDAVNASGETTGATWSFTTGVAPEPEPGPTMQVSDLDAAALAQPRNRWQAAVTVAVRDDAGQGVAGATVTGQWSNGASGSQDCQTDSSGSCVLAKGNLKGSVGSVTLTIIDVVHAAYDYLPAANGDPDGDSDGSTIVVYRDSTPPANTAPVTTITSPADGAQFSSGSNILLSASAQDAESGDLSAAISWRVNGNAIGTGASLSHDFGEGASTVEASATDPEGASGTDSITITIGAGAPGVDIASLTDESLVDTRNWTAIARVVLVDGSGTPIANAGVSGSWSEGAKGSASCTTAADGSCQLTKNRMKLSVGSVRITIDSVTVSGTEIVPGGVNTRLLSQ